MLCLSISYWKICFILLILNLKSQRSKQVCLRILLGTKNLNYRVKWTGNERKGRENKWNFWCTLWILLVHHYVNHDLIPWQAKPTPFLHSFTRSKFPMIHTILSSVRGWPCKIHRTAPTLPSATKVVMVPATCLPLAAEQIHCLSSCPFPIATAAGCQLLLLSFLLGHHLLGPLPSPHMASLIFSSQCNLLFPGFHLLLTWMLLLLVPQPTYLSITTGSPWQPKWKSPKVMSIPVSSVSAPHCNLPCPIPFLYHGTYVIYKMILSPVLIL
jgi:hypothetical protein